MGEVYRARDTRLDRTVAIKVLPTHLASNQHMLQRFEREARAISRLAHPNICTLFDVGSQGGIEYLVIEYLEGQTLADLLRRGALPPDQVIRYGAEIAGALSEAHRQGIVHRDLKPSNIMLTRSGLKVLDFGLAAFVVPAQTPLDPTSPTEQATQQKPLTEEGVAVGTLQYMSPEQLAGGQVDARSDIFSLGTILYEMSTGRRAFDGTSRASVIAAILERDPPPISTLQPLTPPALEQLVRHCMAKAPDDRFQSVRDLQFALEQISDQERSGSGVRSAPGVTPHPVAMRKRTWIAAAALASIVLAVIGWLVVQRRAAATGFSRVRTVAVLPLAGFGLDPQHEYLRIAIADEITTILSTHHSLTVRPFSVSRHLNADIAPQKAAKELNAAGIISGSVRTQGGRLFISLEGIDAGQNKLLWRDSFEGSSTDLLTMRRELSSRIREGLMPRLAPTENVAERNEPRNQEAYAKFLRAAAMSTDPIPNEEALQVLEEAVKLDPGHPQAWVAIAERAYYSYAYHTGGAAAFRRAHEAVRRALELDPDLAEAAARQALMRAEAGETVQAWRDGIALVQRRPESAVAHLVLAYALRYGGALEESARECETAWRLDPNRQLRSCSQTFIGLQNLSRAEDFLGLDAGSAWANNATAAIRMRQGRIEEAVRLLSGGRADILRGVLQRNEKRIDAGLAEQRARIAPRHDGEPYYNVAAYAAVAGRPTEALELLTEATRRNFCGHPASDGDPAFESLRKDPRWPAYREKAIACHQAFMRGIAAP
jgi:TolB-like protein